MLTALKTKLKRLPRYQWMERSLRSATGRYREVEIGLLRYLAHPDKAAFDVGAHTGVYTHALLEVSARVVAIEANPRLARGLQRLYGRRAQIVCAAASSTHGTTTLRLPRAAPPGADGIGTVEAENTLNGASVDEIEVPRITLDSLGQDAVGFIKIDVEGHEVDVLAGAREILRRDRPAILVEAEERHRQGALQSVTDLLSPLGYYGLMLDCGRLAPLSAFDGAKDQAIASDEIDRLNAGAYRGRYVNNFIFLAGSA